MHFPFLTIFVVFIIVIAIGLAVVKANMSALSKEGYVIKHRTFTQNYLGGHPDMPLPTPFTIIYPKDESLFILYYEKSNMLYMPLMGGEIPMASVLNITTESAASFLVIEWRQDDTIHKTTFQYNNTSGSTALWAQQRLLAIIGTKNRMT